MPDTKDIRFIALVGVAILLTGMAMKWGYDNDIPVLKHAANGYDQ